MKWPTILRLCSGWAGHAAVILLVLPILVQMTSWVRPLISVPGTFDAPLDYLERTASIWVWMVPAAALFLVTAFLARRMMPRIVSEFAKHEAYRRWCTDNAKTIVLTNEFADVAASDPQSLASLTGYSAAFFPFDSAITLHPSPQLCHVYSLLQFELVSRSMPLRRWCVTCLLLLSIVGMSADLAMGVVDTLKEILL